MPGVAQLSVDHAVRECEEAHSLGIPAVILFGLPEHKDAVGSEAYDDDGIVQQAIGEIKRQAARASRHHRCLSLRIHRSRPLRRD